MPFDFKDYQTKCDDMSTEQLHREWENYTRQISGGATSTATSVLFAPVTGGISLVGLGLAAPKIHNARKKREIIEAGLKARGTTSITRKRDVIAPMAVAGTIGTLTVGLAGGAASHVVLDAGGSALEHQHGKHQHQKANQRLEAQYENFKVQYAQEQAAAQRVQYPVAGYQPGLKIPGSIQNPQGPQPTNPTAPSGANPTGSPSVPYSQVHGNVPLPSSYYYGTTGQLVAQQQTSFHAGASFEIYASESTSYQQSNDLSHQPNLHEQKPHIPIGQQTAHVPSYPSEKPPILSYSSPCPTPLPLYSPPQTAPSQPDPSPLQHRPSLPTPTITSHAPVHRPSLPVAPALAPAPVYAPHPSVIREFSTPASPVYEMSTSTGRTTPSQSEGILSIEEELALLRMKVLQMELEKRGEHVEVVLEDDKEEDEDETPKPPEIPETFPTEAYAPEPPRKTQETKPKPVQMEDEVEVKPDSGRPTEPLTAPSPKLNVFVDLQQPVPLNPTKPQYKDPAPRNNLPYPTFSTPQPEKQQQQPPPEILTLPIPTSVLVPAPAIAAHKTGFSITGGISIAYNRDTSQSQTTSNPQDHCAVGSASNESETQYQQTPTQCHVYSASHVQSPPLSSYQAYHPHQRTSSIPMSPQQQTPTQHQGFPISYETAPLQLQSNAGVQTYNLVHQNPTTPGPQQQQIFATPQKPLPPHHTDSGYYSNPASNPTSRHSSSFSVATVASLNINHNQHVVSPPTPAYATLNQQQNAPQQTQQYSNARHSSYGSTSYTPSPMSPPPPQYFPPPPASAPPRFGQNNPSRVATPMQACQPAPLGSPAPIYGNIQSYQPGPASAPPVYGGQQGRNGGWQWGNPNAGAPGEPNYGAPPPIPGQWRGS